MSHKAAWRSADSAASRMRARLRIPLKRSPEVTLSRMLMVGNGFGLWNTIPIRARTSSGSVSGA